MFGRKRVVITTLATVIGISAICAGVYSSSILGTGVKYNSEKNECYNSDNFIPNNNVKGGYEQKVEPQQSTDDSVSFNKWIEEHKNSSDEIDKILIEYMNTETQDIDYSSVYIPQNDKKLDIIVKYGIKIFPKIIEKVENSEYKVWRSILMAAANKITLANPDPTFFTTPDSTEEGVKTWKNKILTLANSPSRDKIDNTNIKDIVYKYGIFVLPQLSENFKDSKDNKEIKKYLSLLISLKDKNKIEEYDLPICEKWVNEHKNEIEIIKNLKQNLKQ